MTWIIQTDIPWNINSCLPIKGKIGTYRKLAIFSSGTLYASVYPKEVVSDCFCISCFLQSPSPFSSTYSIFFFFVESCVFLLVSLFFLSSSPSPVRVVPELLCGAYLPTGVNPQQPHFVGLSYSSPEDSGIILVLMHPDLLICTLKKDKCTCRCEYTGLCVHQWKKENNCWSGAQLNSILILAVF